MIGLSYRYTHVIPILIFIMRVLFNLYNGLNLLAKITIIDIFPPNFYVKSFGPITHEPLAAG